MVIGSLFLNVLQYRIMQYAPLESIESFDVVVVYHVKIVAIGHGCWRNMKTKKKAFKILIEYNLKKKHSLSSRYREAKHRIWNPYVKYTHLGLGR